ncbi:hypothetical protein B4099_0025 [Heyndrickxia coagulans]|uniref:Uncharacterized protein n=1 Tax=Heyndrickxia coagulans TaxID=1398 RepID=A0A150K9M7_HEYCO|nr:hypothetical protein B4099_0025 [Heyndrickxia coagulans]
MNIHVPSSYQTVQKINCAFILINIGKDVYHNELKWLLLFKNIFCSIKWTEFYRSFACCESQSLFKWAPGPDVKLSFI